MTGGEFRPHELEWFVYWRDEHKQLVEIHYHLGNVKRYPAKENILPFRGGRRMTATPWIPTKSK